MAKDYMSDVRRNNEIVAELESSGAKAKDMPLKRRFTRPGIPKGTRRKGDGNKGGVGRAGRRAKRAYLGVGSGPEWHGPKRT